MSSATIVMLLHGVLPPAILVMSLAVLSELWSVMIVLMLHCLAATAAAVLMMSLAVMHCFLLLLMLLLINCVPRALIYALITVVLCLAASAACNVSADAALSCS